MGRKSVNEITSGMSFIDRKISSLTLESRKKYDSLSMGKRKLSMNQTNMCKIKSSSTSVNLQRMTNFMSQMNISQIIPETRANSFISNIGNDEFDIEFSLYVQDLFTFSENEEVLCKSMEKSLEQLELEIKDYQELHSSTSNERSLQTKIQELRLSQKQKLQELDYWKSITDNMDNALREASILEKTLCILNHRIALTNIVPYESESIFSSNKEVKHLARVLDETAHVLKKTEQIFASPIKCLNSGSTDIIPFVDVLKLECDIIETENLYNDLLNAKDERQTLFEIKEMLLSKPQGNV